MYQFLLTVTVIVVVAVVLRLRAGGTAGTQRREDPAPRRDSSPRRAGRSWRRPSPRTLAGYALVAVLLAGVSGMAWMEWQQAHEVVHVRVVDTRTGGITEYRVYRKDIGGRSFHTVDGRFVSLSDADRMELREDPPG
ncbi:hypothetical protein KBTX_01862 [wastewater metagenome]|uniref:Uncharacterized protein n=2 Tax=unclassified sequences TaxID=12908 RepID=A0A5B8R8S4_9ZZZZ|nr:MULTISPECIES: hypothetical protein [Arhodomonas]MCS4504491.1 hypothetical protein [Arhodomonas aquaeolei]QEA05539.1 hypothetical protein KBTEX_01862 [uncultured organism]